jgi:hypothetical protein
MPAREKRGLQMGALFGGFAREARLSRRVQLKTIADAL